MIKKRIIKNPAILFALAVSILLNFISGCGGTDSPEARTSDSSATYLEPVQLNDDYQLPNVTPEKQYKIGVLFPFLAAPFWINESYGILDQAEQMGLEVVWFSADGYTNIEKQISQFEDLLALEVDAILLGATSYTGVVPAIRSAAQKGIPVITHVTSADSDELRGAVLSNDFAIGAKQAEYMAEKLQGSGNVVMLNGPAAAEWSTNRAKGFKETIANYYPNITIIAERNGVPDRADAQRLAEDLLSSFDSIDGIFTVADGMAMGAANAVKERGLLDSITITTASFSRETIEYIRNGWIDVNVDESPLLLGRLAVIRAVQVLNGEPVPSVTYVPIPSWTIENIDSVNADQQWAPVGWSPQKNN